MTRRNVEGAIQRSLVQWVKKTYPFIKLAASQNENSRHATGMGMDIGEPDIRLCAKGADGVAYFHYLELKTSKGKLGDNQIKWNVDFDANWQSRNFTRSAAYGFAEARQQIENWLAATPL